MRDRKEKARRDAATSKRAKRESHQAGGNPYGNYTTTQSGGQGTIFRLLMEGAGNGLHLQDLVRLTGEDQRTVRKLIQEERLQGIPILSDNVHGYFLPGSDYEREICVKSLRGRAQEILETAAAIEGSKAW